MTIKIIDDKDFYACPFCGCSDIGYNHGEDWGTAFCKTCGARRPYYFGVSHSPSKESALAAWNKRDNGSIHSMMVKEAKAEVEKLKKDVLYYKTQLLEEQAHSKHLNECYHNDMAEKVSQVNEQILERRKLEEQLKEARAVITQWRIVSNNQCESLEKYQMELKALKDECATCYRVKRAEEATKELQKKYDEAIDKGACRNAAWYEDKLEKLIKERDILREKSNELAPLEAHCDEVSGINKRLVEIVDAQNKENDELKSQIGTYEQHIEQLDKEIFKLRKEHSNGVNAIVALQVKLRDLEREHAQLQKVYTQEVTHHYTLLDPIRAELKKCKEDLALSQKNWNDLRCVNLDLGKEKKALEDRCDQLQECWEAMKIEQAKKKPAPKKKPRPLC